MINSASTESASTAKTGGYNSNFDEDSKGSSLSSSGSQNGDSNIQFVEV
jgi:hypothetical protein